MFKGFESLNGLVGELAKKGIRKNSNSEFVSWFTGMIYDKDTDPDIVYADTEKELFSMLDDEEALKWFVEDVLIIESEVGDGVYECNLAILSPDQFANKKGAIAEVYKILRCRILSMCRNDITAREKIIKALQ